MNEWYQNGMGEPPVPQTPVTPPQEENTAPATPQETDVNVAPEEAVPPAEQPPVQQTPPTDWRANPYAAPTAEPPVPPSNPTPDADGWYHGVPVNNEQPPVPPVPPTSFTPPVPPTPAPMPPRKKRHNGAVVFLAVVGSVAILALSVLLVFTLAAPPTAGEPTPPASDTNDTDNTVNENAPTVNISDWADDDGGLSASQIIDKNFDSTVVINVYQMKIPSNIYQYGFGGETLTQVGEATGIVMTADGYIITNWHVVIDEDTDAPFDRIDVVLHDGTVYEDAKVIGSDKSTDLAVIKVDGKNMKTATFGDSSKLIMGARVVTLGNAGGLQWSASQGIVSGLARDVYEDTGYAIKCLQTDAAINPGNSGGPLINNQGQVVGINSAKISNQGYEGLGFAIPINEAKTIIDDLIKYGYPRGRVELGITGYSISTGGYKGFVISSIGENSVLKSTHARVGDLITAIDGKDITGYNDLRSELAKHKAGDTVTLSLTRLDSRTGQESKLTVNCKLVESKPQKK